MQATITSACTYSEREEKRIADSNMNNKVNKTYNS